MADLAAAQHGVVSRAQLRAIGLSDRQITRARAMSRLHGVHRGVTAVGHRRLSVTGKRMAAVLACGTDAALGYRSAAAHWDLRPSSTNVTEVVVPRSSTPRHARVIAHRQPRLHAAEVAVHDGVPVTTVARTLLDMASVVSPDELRRAVGQADLLQRFDQRDLDAVIRRHPNHRGRRPLDRVLATWEEPDRVRSPQERDFPALCARFGFPRPSINAIVLGMEVDAVFFDHGVAVELDGYQTHSRRLQWEEDHERRARLVAAGWVVLSFSWRQVTRDGGRAVREALGPALEQGAARLEAGLPAAHRGA